MKKHLIIIKISFLFLLLGISGCSDFLDVGKPTTQVSRSAVFEDDVTANAAVLGIYGEMTSSSGFASGGTFSVTQLVGRSSDEFINYATSQSSEFAANEISENNSFLNSYLWQEMYEYIYQANAVLEGVSQSVGMSSPMKEQLQGEAKFIRAFIYFYLVNLFGEVPIVTTTDYRVNAIVARSSTSTVYEQIISDLTDAKALLKEDYSASAGQKTRANKFAATAMLARVYVYTQNWTAAEREATELTDKGLQLENSLDKVFLKNSTEAIWQLVPRRGKFSTDEGDQFLLTAIPTQLSLAGDLVTSFEPGDLRKTGWTGQLTVSGNTFFFPTKYKVRSGTNLTEYSMVLRMGEQYLIRAEARAHLQKLPDAILDLDIIRKRAGLPLYQNTNPSIGQQALLEVIHNERRHELFSEWAHRWFDLKRSGEIDQVLVNKPDAFWDNTDVLYPVPLVEIQNNQNLLPQNKGY